jgi:2-succinyl-6-hydroxy-2,4-cyclohexadiene-1-carboxylate synthase
LADYLALHGFTQRGSMWQEVAGLVGGQWETPDLPGHGREPSVGWAEAVAGVCRGLERSGPATTLVGYSMGGRIALAAALECPAAGARLVLVSASPGIADPADRERRRQEDERLADRIERIGSGLFVDEWLARPMFAGLGRRSRAWGAADRRMRTSNTATGLAGALRLLGQGVQPFLGARLAEIAIPVVAVAGEADQRYVRYAKALASGAPEGRFVAVRGAGHGVVGEDPRAVARAIAG